MKKQDDNTFRRALVRIALLAPLWSCLGQAEAEVAVKSPAFDAMPMAARYRVSMTLKSRQGATKMQDWYLLRDASQIAYIKGATEDIWRRDAKGGIHLERVFREDRHIVHYPAAELRALGVEVDWKALASLIDERDLRRLKPVGQADARGWQVYEGRLHGDQVTVTWDPVAHLPVRLHRRSAASGEVSYRLIEAHASPPPRWPVPAAATQNYTRIDAADFGDMAYDEFVRKAEARALRSGWGLGHGH